MSKDSERGRYTSPEGSRHWEYISAMCCALLIFNVGCVAGWTSPSLSILMGPETPVPITSSDASTLGTMIALGHALAPGLTMTMAKKLGRKNSLIVAGISTIIQWGLIAVANDLMIFLFARFVGGLSMGLILSFPAMYLGEIATAKLRGAIGMVCGTMMSAGLLFMFSVAPHLSIKTMACVCFGTTTISTISIWFIPDSPYSLASIGKFDKAEEALEKLRGKADVVEELEMIKMTIKPRGNVTEGYEEDEGHQALKKPSAFHQLFKVPGYRKALLINLLFMASIEFGGFVLIMVYGEIIFGKMKTGISSHVCSMIVGILQLTFNIITAFVIDKSGRKPLICISGVVSGACFLIIGIYFYSMEYAKIDVAPYGMLAACTIFLCLIVLNIGLVPMQQVTQAETLATEIKELATCIIGVGGGVMAIISIKSYLMVAETWGLGHCVPFFTFAANTWICTFLIMKLLPETKGKTLYQIQKDLNA